MKCTSAKHKRRKVAFLSLLCIAGTYLAPVHAQESCYEQYLREHNKKILTAEDADDSYDELKKTVLAKQMYGDSYLLMVDTIAQSAKLTKVDGTYVADVHLTLVDSTWYMWLSVDPLADKYPGNSPYMYCNGNPIMLIDPDGRKIIPSTPDDQTMNMADLCEAFGGDRMKYITYDGTTGLQIIDESAFCEGLTQDQMLLYNGLWIAINSPQEMRLTYSYTYIDNVGMIQDVNTNCGGGLTNLETNEMTISPMPPTILTVQTVEDLFLNTSTKVENNTRVGVFFHEIGEFNLGKSPTREKAIDLENAYRRTKSYENRPYDVYHDSRVPQITK